MAEDINKYGKAGLITQTQISYDPKTFGSFLAPVEYLDHLEALQLEEDGTEKVVKVSELFKKIQQGGSLEGLRIEVKRELQDDADDFSKIIALKEAIETLMVADYRSSNPTNLDAFVVNGKITENVELSKYTNKISTQLGLVDNAGGTRFFPLEAIQLKSDTYAVLNGVVAQAGTWSFIVDSNSGINVGIEFAVAPEVNSIVELIVSGAEAIDPVSFDKAIQKNKDLADIVKADATAYTDAGKQLQMDYAAEIDRYKAEVADAETKRDSYYNEYLVNLGTVDAAENVTGLRAAETKTLANWKKYTGVAESILPIKTNMDKVGIVSENDEAIQKAGEEVANNTILKIGEINIIFESVKSNLDSALSFYKAQFDNGVLPDSKSMNP